MKNIPIWIFIEDPYSQGDDLLWYLFLLFDIDLHCTSTKQFVKNYHIIYTNWTGHNSDCTRL